MVVCKYLECNILFLVLFLCVSCTASNTEENDPNPAGDSNDDISAPEISNISVQSISSSAATILWETNELATAQVEYGLSTDYGLISSLDSNLALSHSERAGLLL